MLQQISKNVLLQININEVLFSQKNSNEIKTPENLQNMILRSILLGAIQHAKVKKKQTKKLFQKYFFFFSLFA